MADLAVEFSLPLAVDGHLGDFDNVSDVQSESRLVISIGDTSLFHTSVCGQFSLGKEIGEKYLIATLPNA